jgi:hypothetical protein
MPDLESVERVEVNDAVTANLRPDAAEDFARLRAILDRIREHVTEPRPTLTLIRGGRGDA